MNRPLPVPARRAAEAGFTLIEVLVGALVLGIFVAFVYGVVVSGFQVRDVIQRTTSALASGSVAVDLVARDLEAAFWRPVDELEAFRATHDDATGSRVDFLTTTDSRRQDEIDHRLLRSDVTEVGYRVRDGILYRREDFAVDEKPLDGGDWFKVVAEVIEFRIDWFEKDPSSEGKDEEAETLQAWDSKEKKRLPRSAKIVLVLRGKSTEPDRPEDMVDYEFVRWVILPGADDREPQAPAPGPGGQ